MRGQGQVPTSVHLNGTLNLVTSAIATPPGDAIAGVNYLPHERGYQRIPGFERLDGQPSPSSQSYWVLNFDQGSAAVSAGDTVTGQDSGETGIAVIDGVVSSGSYGGGDAAGYLVLREVGSTGFNDNESLLVSASPVCVADGTESERGADNDTDDRSWLQSAIEAARTLIQKPTGTSGILGVWIYNGDKYCVRNDTTGKLYKATSSGWVAQSLGSYLKFDAGTAAFTVGDTITGAMSSHTATVVRQVLRRGAFGDGDAEGLLIVSSASGTFQDNETITGAISGSATTDGTVTANTLPSTGHHEYINHNFFGATDLKRMYGVSGQGPAFEWDGSVFVPLFTGMPTDTPNHIAKHKKTLLLGFPGGSLQTSSLADPYGYTPITGAEEIGMGDDITGMIQDVAGATIVFARNLVSALYGNDTSDMILKEITDDAGGIEWTCQRVGDVVYMDDRGFRNVSATAAYGDFKKGTLSLLISPLFDLKKKSNIYPVASVRVKSRDEYRVFFSDGTGIACYLGGKHPRLMPFDLGVNVTCACSGEDSNGVEIVLIGTDDGWVYEMEAGTSFDGAEVDAFIRLAFNHVGSPSLVKRFHKATVEGDFKRSNNIAVLPEFDYADVERPPTVEQNFTVYGSGAFWDESMIWENFFWDNAVEGRAEARISGKGRNCSITVISSDTYEEPHILHGLTLHWTPRNIQR